MMLCSHWSWKLFFCFFPAESSKAKKDEWENEWLFPLNYETSRIFQTLSSLIAHAHLKLVELKRKRTKLYYNLIILVSTCRKSSYTNDQTESRGTLNLMSNAYFCQRKNWHLDLHFFQPKKKLHLNKRIFRRNIRAKRKRTCGMNIILIEEHRQFSSVPPHFLWWWLCSSIKVTYNVPAGLVRVLQRQQMQQAATSRLASADRTLSVYHLQPLSHLQICGALYTSYTP